MAISTERSRFVDRFCHSITRLAFYASTPCMNPKTILPEHNHVLIAMLTRFCSEAVELHQMTWDSAHTHTFLFNITNIHLEVTDIPWVYNEPYKDEP